MGFHKFMSMIQTSFKIMVNLPYVTHRYFHEALTDTQHAVLQIKRRFLNFIGMINQFKKPRICKNALEIFSELQMLLELIQHDLRSTTGANLRNLILYQSGIIEE